MESKPCALNCGHAVHPHEDGVWKEVIGFVGGPKKDSMRLRQDTGRYAHNVCVEKAQSGQAIDQPDIFEPPAVVVTGADLPGYPGGLFDPPEPPGPEATRMTEEDDRREDEDDLPF